MHFAIRTETTDLHDFLAFRASSWTFVKPRGFVLTNHMADFQENYEISNLGKEETLIFKHDTNMVNEQIQICNRQVRT